MSLQLSQKGLQLGGLGNTEAGTGDTAVAYFDFVNRKYRPSPESAAFEFTRDSVATYPLNNLPLVTSAANVPRFDDGLFVEPESANLMLNLQYIGAVPGVVGSGGFLPTGMDTNVAVTREVISVTEQQGMAVLRLKLSRTGGAPLGQNISARYNGFQGPAITGGSALGQAWIKIVSKTPSVAGVRLTINSNGVSDSNANIPIDATKLGEWQRALVIRGASLGANAALAISTDLTANAVDFEIVLDFGLYMLETTVAPAALTGAETSMIPVSNTRKADTLKLNVPNGVYDRLFINGLTSSTAIPVWTSGVNIAGGAGDPIPATTNRRDRRRHAAYFPAGKTVTAKDAYLNKVAPVVWAANQIGNFPVDGGVFSTQTVNRPHSFRRATNRGNMYRFELRENKFPPLIDGPSGNGVDRCELSGNASIVHGSEVWYAWNQKFEILPEVPSVGFSVFHQLHDQGDVTDTISPPPCYEIGFLAGTRKLVINTSGSAANPLTSYAQLVQNRLYTGTVDIVQGQDYRFVVAVKEGYDGTGRLRVWLDGELLCDFTGVIGYNNVLGSYPKFGFYRARSPSTIASVVSMYTLSAASLLDRVANPVPIS